MSMPIEDRILRIEYRLGIVTFEDICKIKPAIYNKERYFELRSSGLGMVGAKHVLVDEYFQGIES